MKFWAILGAAVAAAGMATSANASTLVSLQPEGGDTTNHIFITPGLSTPQVITIDVHVIVTGTTAGAGEDGLQQLVGNFRTGTGGLLGNLAPAGDAVGTGTGFGVNGFNGSGSVVGTLQDADADGDIDMGKTITTPVTGSDWGARNANGQVTNTSGSIADIIVGKLTLTVGPNAVAGATTNVTYAITGGLISVRTDNVTSTITSATGFTGADAIIDVVAVPEPASIGLLALGGVALLARRRKQA